MTSRELQGAFEYEVNKHDAPNKVVPSHEIFYWLNKAIEEYVEVKYSNGTESFEETQKVTDELKDLLEEVVSVVHPNLEPHKSNWYYVNLPSNYLHSVTESAWITYNTDPITNEVTVPGLSGTNSHNRLVGITKSSTATLNRQLADPYSEHKLHYEHAKPLRLFYQGEIQLVSDGWYRISEYVLRYLRKPTEINLEGGELTYLPDYVHLTIAHLAAGMYLKSIGAVAVPSQQPQTNNN